MFYRPNEKCTCLLGEFFFLVKFLPKLFNTSSFFFSPINLLIWTGNVKIRQNTLKINLQNVVWKSRKCLLYQKPYYSAQHLGIMELGIFSTWVKSSCKQSEKPEGFCESICRVYGAGQSRAAPSCVRKSCIW